MATLTFDTLKFVKRLKSAGFNDEQSEALSEAQRESLADILDTSVSTKSDIARLEKEIESLRRDVKEVEMRLTIRLGLMIAASIAIVAALVKLL